MFSKFNKCVTFLVSSNQMVICDTNNTNHAIEWYKKLSIEQKIGLKECTVLLTGMRWEDYTILFTPRQRIEILYDKLKLERYDV